MRFNIPRFACPTSVLDEETSYIIDMGAEVRYDTPVDEPEGAARRGHIDAVFVGSGAPKGKELDIPGRWDDGAREQDPHRHRVARLRALRPHRQDRPRVLIIGVGNTAMDCCRTSRRLGGIDTKVVARRSRPVLQGFAVGARRRRGGRHRHRRESRAEALRRRERKARRHGVRAARLDRRQRPADEQRHRHGHHPVRRSHPRHRTGQRVSLDRARHRHRHSTSTTCRSIDKTTFESTRPGVFFGGDAAWGPQNIIWAVEHGHQAAISIHQHCQGMPVAERPPEGMHLESTKMGMHSWAYSNDFNPSPRAKMQHAELVERFSKLERRGGAGLHARADGDRSRALPQLRHRDALRGEALHRVRRVRRRLPGELSHDRARRRDEADLRTMLSAPAVNLDAGPLRLRRAAADEARDGEGRGHLPPLRTVRRAVSDGRVGHAEVRAGAAVCVGSGRCRQSVTSYERRQRLRIQDGHRERHGLGQRQQPAHAGDLPHGHSGHGQEHLPVEHPGTADVVRDSRQQGRLHRAARRKWISSSRSIRARTRRTSPRCGRAAISLYDSSWPLEPELVREGITILGIPFGKMCVENFQGDRNRTLLRNIVYVGRARGAARDRHGHRRRDACARSSRRRRRCSTPTTRAIQLGYDYAKAHYECPLPFHLEQMDATSDSIIIDGNSAAALGAVYAGATVGAWYPITPSTSLMEAFTAFCEKFRTEPETGLAQVLHHPGGRRAVGGRASRSAPAGRARARSRTRRARASR